MCDEVCVCVRVYVTISVHETRYAFTYNIHKNKEKIQWSRRCERRRATQLWFCAEVPPTRSLNFHFVFMYVMCKCIYHFMGTYCNTHTHTHTHTLSHTPHHTQITHRSHTHTRTRTHAHAHTHTHTPACSSWALFFYHNRIQIKHMLGKGRCEFSKKVIHAEMAGGWAPSCCSYLLVAVHM